VSPEAPLRRSKNGLVTDGEGWFVVNARESRWRDEGVLGTYCTFEGKRRFPHFGINISVLEPGQAIGMYHRENGQEAFLVLSGECTLIVEGQERTLSEWDFFYCAPGTEHALVTTREQRAVVLAVGARGRGAGGGLVYRVSEAAARHGASVQRETTSSAEAYAHAHAGLPRSKWAPYRPGLLRDDG
jgi:quercetin dioxygenase-like cupin family protein